MGNKRKLKEIIDYKNSEKRIGKSKYFTEDFFKKHPTKYENLINEFDCLIF